MGAYRVLCPLFGIHAEKDRPVLAVPSLWGVHIKREKRKMSKLLDIFGLGSCFVGGVCLADGKYFLAIAFIVMALLSFAFGNEVKGE